MNNPNILSRRGVSLIELLVIIGILGILVSLLLPAVQDARESARRAQCKNNMRQLGLALHGYVASHGVIPAASCTPEYVSSASTPIISVIQIKQYSAYTQILPYFEQASLFNAFNFSAFLDDFYLYPQASGAAAANTTVVFTTLNTLLCASDSNNRNVVGAVNYRVNLGTDRWQATPPTRIDGPIASYACTNPAAITDGLSQTVMLSEKLSGHLDTNRIDLKSAMIEGGLGYPYTPLESLAACANRRIPAEHFVSYPFGGLLWSVGTYSQTCYNHIFTPNSTIPDCVLGSSEPMVGLVGARSEHRGGVNILKADGSSSFVLSTINQKVWMAIGTRAGGELVEGF